MFKSCLDGYLTPECANCPFWENGTNGSIGCSKPTPIEWCEAFAKMEKESEVKA